MRSPLLRARDASQLLSISKSYLYLLVQRGEIPVVKFGTSVRFREEDLIEYIERHTAGRTNEITSSNIPPDGG